VIHRLTEFLTDQDTPKFWAPFAYSIRGLAYEYVNDWKMAKHDYSAGMRVYAELEEEFVKKVESGGGDKNGMREEKERLRRMQTNVEFMKTRKSSLPPEPGKSTDMISEMWWPDEAL
jgi:hypothetical protein